MRLDATLPPTSLSVIPQLARAAEEMGFDGLWTSETMHDPFLPGPLIAEHTQRIHFGTAVAIAFARSPATLAYTAWDLAQASGGRFILGLGTQVKGHIERRFGMPWPESVVGKLREQVAAVRAFWHAWQTGEKLNFRGEHYKLTLMSPFFNPGKIACPDIPIYIAGVNPGLASLAGETADGFHVHPLHSKRYLEEVIRPAIAKGAAQAGRDPAAIQIFAPALVVAAPEDDLFVRTQIAFYASTPSYRKVLAVHGWQAVGEQLSGLAARGNWGEMTALIDDEILNTFAIVADTGGLADALRNKYESLVDRLGLYLPFVPGEREDLWQAFLSSRN